MHILPFINKITFHTCIIIINDHFVYLMYDIFNTENRNNPTGFRREPTDEYLLRFIFISFLFFITQWFFFPFWRRPQWSARCFVLRYRYRALHVMTLPCTRLSYVLAHTRVIVNTICFHFLSSPCTRFAPP